MGQDSYLGNPIDRGGWQATVHVSQRVEHNLATEHICSLSDKKPKESITNKRKLNTSVTKFYSVFLYHSNGHEVGQILGDGEGQGGLVCCSSWGCKESDTT